FFEQIIWPPGVRQSSQFVPTGGQHTEAASDLAQTMSRKLVVWSDKSFWSWEARFHQQFRPLLQARGDFSLGQAFEFQIFVKASGIIARFTGSPRSSSGR